MKADRRRTRFERKLTILFRSAVCFMALGFALPSGTFALSNQEILQAADKARGNVEGVSWTVEIVSEGKRKRTQTMEVKARAFDIRAVTLKPSKNRGDKVIMLNGNMWFHKPGLSKPVPISRRQRLQGPASYGDIASTNYATDYDATLLNEEEINGELCYVFDLHSANKRNTYARIKYWVSKERLVGIRAQYFTLSDELFKSADMEYEHVIETPTQPQPFISRISMQDELLSKDTTTLSLSDPKVKPLPDSTFNLNLLRQ